MTFEQVRQLFQKIGFIELDYDILKHNIKREKYYMNLELNKNSYEIIIDILKEIDLLTLNITQIVSNDDELKQIVYQLGDELGHENKLKKIKSYLFNKNQQYHMYDGNMVIYKNSKYVDHLQSEYQDIRIVDTLNLGRCMFVDDYIQITEVKNQEINIDNYTKDVTNLVLKHKNNEKQLKILIIGGGDLFIANYLLQNPNIQLITLCELDEGVTSIVRKNFKLAENIQKGVDQKRLEINFMDGSIFVKQLQSEQYDGCIVDCSDLENISDMSQPAIVLYSEQFLRDIWRVLKQDCWVSQYVHRMECHMFWKASAEKAGFIKPLSHQSSTPEYMENVIISYALKPSSL